MIYATTAELATYLGVDEADLPSDAERLLERASELVDQAALGRIGTDDADHLAAAQKAACAQVERWIETGESEAIAGQPRTLRLGRFAVETGGSQSEAREGAVLADRARRHLFLAGLLYRGVQTR